MITNTPQVALKKSDKRNGEILQNFKYIEIPQFQLKKNASLIL